RSWLYLEAAACSRHWARMVSKMIGSEDMIMKRVCNLMVQGHRTPAYQCLQISEILRFFPTT
ncbi:MAG: hypothetical protein OXF06_08430, partial [Bacteroidetes bacterium]|nr:hypothetical protein [Bacteroidota bacterium]